MGRTYTVVILHEKDGRYSAIAPALNCASWGDTVPEAIRNVEEAISGYIEVMTEHGMPVPDDTDTFTVEMGDAVDAVIYRVVIQEELASVA